MIYLDNGATTFPKPEMVYKAMEDLERNLAFNPGRGTYRLSRTAMELVDDTREKLLRLAGCRYQGEVIFTPSATIAVNQILNGFYWGKGQWVYISPYEHNAVVRTLYYLQQQYGFGIKRIPLVRKSQEIDMERLKYEFTDCRPFCVCMSGISNVTGYILPIEEITMLAKQYGAIVLVDGSQSFGVMPVDLQKSMVDFLVFSGHKSLYGPFGAGGFIKNTDLVLKPYLTGGTGSDSLNVDMPGRGTGRYEAGSLNITAIGGLGAGLDFIRETDGLREKQEHLTQYLYRELKGLPGVICYAPPEKSHIGMVSFNIKGYMASEVGNILDEEFQIAVRTGYHCAPFIHEELGDIAYGGTVRASMGYFNTEQELQQLVRAVKDLI